MSNLGVTVSPVTVQRLEDFAPLEEVARKLVAAEMAKDGTLRADVTRTASRTTLGGSTLYEERLEQKTSLPED